MNEYQRFYDTYSLIADIYILYILEAHFVEKDDQGNFTGGWPIGYQYNYPQHKTLDDRRNMVQLMLDEYHPTIPVLMDNMNNDFQNAYNPWPDKALMFYNGIIKYMSMVNDDGTRDSFWTGEISSILENN